VNETQSDKDNVLTRSHGASSPEPTAGQELARRAEAARQHEGDVERQLEEIRRERNELQELRRKMEEYSIGRKEMQERLTRSLVILEHADIETQRRADTIKNAVASFRALKEELASIRHEDWDDADPNFQQELAKALAVVDTARNEFNHYCARLEVLDEKRNPDAALAMGPLAEFAPKENLLSKLGPWELVKLGFAVSLPLIILGAILIGVLLFRK